MDKRVLLGGAGVVVIAIAIAAAQMYPSNSEVPDDLVTETDDNPFEGLNDVFNEKGPDLGMTEEQIEAEDDFLQISPDGDDAESSSQAAGTVKTENVPYSSCQKAPELDGEEFNARSADGYATRMIYAYVQMKQVVDTQDCTCAGKVAPFSEVVRIKAELVEEHGEDWHRRKMGQFYNDESNALKKQAEAICGGEF